MKQHLIRPKNDDLKRVTKDETQMFDALFKGVMFSIWLRRQSNIRIPSFVIPSKSSFWGALWRANKSNLTFTPRV